ncbi:MAG: transposase [Deltaproteobacteria bacterium]|nr:transposase [Deltaproteobacteria bacterium]
MTPGIIAVIQSFGKRINFHPHLHFLVTEGGTDKQERGLFTSPAQTFDQSGSCQKDIELEA